MENRGSKRATTKKSKAKYSKKLEYDNRGAHAALQNILVLETISTFLAVSDLKNARLVNQLWNQACLRSLRKKVGRLDFSNNISYMFKKHLKTGNRPLRFHSNCNIPHFLVGEDYNIPGHYIVNKCLSTVASLTSTSSMFPVTKFKLCTYNYDPRSNGSDDLITLEFVKTIAPIVTEFAFSKESEESLLRSSIITELAYPNLKLLELSFTQQFSVNWHAYRSWKKDRRFLRDLIEHAPNLDTLVLETPCESTYITDLQKAVRQPHWEKIQHLRLRKHIRHQLLATLATAELKLKSLDINFRKFLPHSADGFMAFLSSQSGTLQELTLRVGPTDSILKVAFPEMTALKILKINVWTKGSLTFSNVSFVQQFPVLKQVTLDTDPEDIYDFINYRVQPLETVKHVQIPKGLWNLQVLTEAIRIFPKMTSGNIKSQFVTITD